MSRNYTTEEQQAAVARLVRSSIRREYGALGNRKTDVEFGDVQDAAAGVFILYPNSPFHVVRLAGDVCAGRATNALVILQDLDDTVRATDRYVSPVEKISSLANARAALGALEGATAERDTSLVHIEDVSAFQRFEQSTARFLSYHGKNISSGGNIVQTPQEAKGRIAGLVSELKSIYEDVLQRVQYLHEAIGDFDSLQLPAHLSNAVISNSRQVIGDRYAELDSLTPEQRLGVLRDVTLDVLAARSTVRGFGALSPTFTFLYFEGEGGPYADSNYPCIPAVVQSNFVGPYVIVDATRLDLLVDGTTSISVDLPKSFVAVINGLIVEPYNIYAVDNPPLEFRNNLLTLSVSGYPDVDVPITAGLNRTAQQIADDINAVVGARPVVAEPYNSRVRFSGEVALVNASGSNVDVEKYGTDDWSTLSTQPEAGDYLYLKDSGAGNDGWYEVTSATGLPNHFTATKQVGSPSNESQVLGELGAGPRAVLVRFVDAYAELAVHAGRKIGLVTGDDEIKQRTHNTLGFIRDVSVKSQRTPVQSCVEFINNNPAIAPSGVARFIADKVFEATQYTGGARTDPTDNLKVVLPSFETAANVLSSGYIAQLEFVQLSPMATGDVIVVRDAVYNIVGNWGKVTALGSGTVWASFHEPLLLETGVGIEVGKDYRGIPLPAVLRIANEPADPNDSEYEVANIGGLNGDSPPFELALARPLLVHTNLGYQRRTFQVQFGHYHLSLASRSTLLDSAIQVASTPAASILWSSLPAVDVGDTVYWSLPEAPKKVERGDYLELKDTSAQQPTFSTEVVKTYTSPALLELADSVEVTVGSYRMRQDASAPSGRVRKRRRDNFDVLQDSLGIWLSNSASTRYFANLRKLLNPIIANVNPTASSVKDATDHLAVLYAHLNNLQTYLAAYEAPLVEQVDRLIETYQQQGSQRAVDILLQARFSDFFGLDQEEVSYTGNLQKAIRQINLNDLPQSKFGRLPGGEVIDSYEEPDFEFDTSDTDAELELDPPDEAYNYPGSAI